MLVHTSHKFFFLFLAAVRAIDEAGCDNITKRRVREVHEIPGALWQIYDAHDADKIRDFLNKVTFVCPIFIIVLE